MIDDAQDEDGAPGAEDLIDELDLIMLADVRALYEALDPVPEDLVARSTFALDLVGLEDEVARLEPEGLAAAGARGTEQSRTITFDSESLTIVVQASAFGGTLRVDGWLAPPAARRLRLRAGEQDFEAESDELGRFVVLGVPRGLVQIVVEGEGGMDGGGRSVVTPAVVL